MTWRPSVTLLCAVPPNFVLPEGSQFANRIPLIIQGDIGALAAKSRQIFGAAFEKQRHVALTRLAFLGYHLFVAM